MRRSMVTLGCVLGLVATLVLSMPAVAGATNVVVPYGASGWRHQVVAHGDGSGFEDPAFDDSSWAVGQAAFGTPFDGCPLGDTVETVWPADTDILLRRTVDTPIASGIALAIAIDNDVFVYWDGVLVGSDEHEGCGERGSFLVTVPNVSAGSHLLALRGVDRGPFSTYIDVQVTAFAAGTIHVDTTDDTISQDSSCSLREAIRSANLDQPIGGCTAGSGADTIIVPAGTYTLTTAGQNENAGLTGDLDITSRLTLRGAGAAETTIDGGQLDRVIQVHAGPRVTIEGVTITGGLLPSTPQPSPKSSGAGVANFANLTLISTVVTENQTSGYYSEYGKGGGVFNSGMLTVRNSTISHNHGHEGGGVFSTGSAYVTRSLIEWNSTGGNHSQFPGGDAGGITSFGYLSVARSVIRLNSGHDEWGHGGISMERGVIKESLITHNGGAICGTGGLMIVGGRLVSSTVSLNATDGCGGAGGVHAIDSQIVNSTISGNVSNLYSAAGMSAEGGTIVNSTITGNSGLWGIGGLSGGNVRNTIVAGNSGPAPDCGGTINSSGHNLIGDATGCSFVAKGSDLVGVDPRIGPLAGNGGPKAGPDGSQEPMLTHTLRPYLAGGSPAIDAWYDGSVGTGASCPRYDQRGVHRPQDGNGDGVAKCDIGALEWMR